MADLEDQRFNKTYLFFNTPSTWVGARDYCEGLCQFNNYNFSVLFLIDTVLDLNTFFVDSFSFILIYIS